MAEYLGTFRHEREIVYHLNKNGRDRVQHDVIRKKTPNIQHFLVRNQLWMHLKRPYSWQNEAKIKVGDTSIVCDALFNQKGVTVFVEVDITQPMINNRKKIDRYKKIKELTDQPFHVVWITEIESRKPKLTELSARLTGRIYTLKEII